MTKPKDTPDFGERFQVDYTDPRSISEGIMIGNGTCDKTLLSEIEGNLMELGLLKYDRSGKPYFKDPLYGLTSFKYNNKPSTKYSGDQIMHQIQTILDQKEGGIPFDLESKKVLTGKRPT